MLLRGIIPAFIATSFLGMGLALAQAPAPASVAIPPGTHIRAELKTKLDTQHAEVGEKVTAVTTSDLKQNGVKLLPKGTQFTGHVTGVTPAESKKSPARIGVLFDQAVTKKGEVLALRAGIARVFQPEPAPAMDMGGPGSMGMRPPQPSPGGDMGSGNMGNVANSGDMDSGNKRNMTLGDQPVPTEVTEPNSAIASLARASNGAQIQILMPRASATPAQRNEGSVLRSTRGNLKLDSGTEIELQIMN